jgi:hypothetical protein
MSEEHIFGVPEPIRIKTSPDIFKTLSKSRGLFRGLPKFGRNPSILWRGK